jgi:hypothetical protein
MRRALYALSKILPVLILLYAIYGLLFRSPHQIWGLPSSAWYIMGAVTAVFVLILGHSEKENKP